MADSKANILIVDDDEYVREVLKRLLEESGYFVATAANSQQATNEMFSYDIDLIVLDIIMPGINGFQILQSIRKKTNLPVIMITALQKTETLLRTLDIGNSDLFKKPFRSAEFLARIEAKLKQVTN